MSTKQLSPLVWTAFVTLCIVWGTTYLGIKVGVKYFPPFFFSAIRHILAGGIFFLIYLFISREMPNWQDFKRLSVAGILMICFGNALLSWSEIYLTSGFAGIMSAMAPLFVSLLSIYAFEGFRLTGRILLGLGIAIFGIILLSKPEDDAILSPMFGLGMLLLTIANFAWGLGSIYMKKYPVDKHPFLRTALQMIPASLINFIISFSFETQPDLSRIPGEAWFALGYLIVFGSLIGYLSYVYVIKYMQPARLSIHVYVNTVVAVLVGWAFGHEHLEWRMWLAMVVVMIGVYIVNAEYAKMAR
jgi:drug/metabolite transporter (DMT)-like permease